MGGDDVDEMPTELVVALVVEAFDGRVLDGAAPAFNRAIGPRMTRLGQAMFDAEIGASPSKAWQRKRTVSARIALISSSLQLSPDEFGEMSIVLPSRDHRDLAKPA